MGHSLDLKRAEKVENRRHAETLSNRRTRRIAGCNLGSVAKTDSQPIETSLDNRHFGLDIHSERGQHVGRSAAARDARLPCLATGTPAAAATIAAAVLTLNVRQPSPPVPHVSTTPLRSVRMGVMWPSHGDCAPAISATVSPLTRSAVSSSETASVPTIRPASPNRCPWSFRPAKDSPRGKLTQNGHGELHRSSTGEWRAVGKRKSRHQWLWQRGRADDSKHADPC